MSALLQFLHFDRLRLHWLKALLQRAQSEERRLSLKASKGPLWVWRPWYRCTIPSLSAREIGPLPPAEDHFPAIVCEFSCLNGAPLLGSRHPPLTRRFSGPKGLSCVTPPSPPPLTPGFFFFFFSGLCPPPIPPVFRLRLGGSFGLYSTNTTAGQVPRPCFTHGSLSGGTRWAGITPRCSRTVRCFGLPMSVEKTKRYVRESVSATGRGRVPPTASTCDIFGKPRGN